MALSGVRILLAEDNPTNQMVAVQMLESLGAEVTLARDGAEALEAAAARAFDLGLIDIEMPRVSGLDVIRRLRAEPGDMPLIALTAYVMDEHREAIDAAGADGVIAKPILSIEKLGEDIRAMAGRRWGAAGGGDRCRAAAAEVPIDREVYDALLGSLGREAMRDIIEKVAEDLLAAQRDIRAALARGDGDLLRRTSHSMIAVAGTIGAHVLQNGAECLNSALHRRENVLAQIENVLSALRAG